MQELLGRFMRMGASQVSDAIRNLGQRSTVMDPKIRPVWKGAKAIGPALTGRSPFGTTCIEAMFEVAQPGDVFVVDAEGCEDSIHFGEIYSNRARNMGIAALVIDGAVRDVDGIEECGFPVFARSVTPYSGALRSWDEIRVPITCGGVVVMPGDLVFGDGDGVVVIPKDMAEATLIEAEKVFEHEETWLAELKAQRS
jgi:regulator of RNase E activity RraA